jgi:hypothetical protein
MTGPIKLYSKASLLERIQSEHHKLETLLELLDENQLTEATGVGNWSVKDILAQITAWERCMLRWVVETRQGLTPRLPTSKHDLHHWNVRIYQENQPRPLAEVLAEFHQSYQEVLKSITDTPEEDLLGILMLQHMPGDTYPVVVDFRNLVYQALVD